MTREAVLCKIRHFTFTKTMSNPMQGEKLVKLLVFLKSDPSNQGLLAEVGNEYLRLGHVAQSVEYFQLLVNAGNVKVGLAGLARGCMAENQFAAAMQHLLVLIADDPSNPVLHMNLGIAKYHMGDHQGAAEYFIQALTLGLESAEGYRYLSYCYHHLGDLSTAISYCEKWLAIAHGSDAMGRLSLLLFDDGDRARARVLATEAFSLNEMTSDALTVLGGLAIEDQRFADAARFFDSATQIRPDDGRAWLGRGLGLLQNRQFEDAVDDLEQAVRLMPSHPGTIITLGWAILLNGRLAQSEQLFRDAIKLDRNFAESHGGLASALALQLKQAEATQVAGVADRLDPHNFGSTYAKATLARAAGDVTRADKLMRRALQSPAAASIPAIAFLKNLLVER